MVRVWCFEDWDLGFVWHLVLAVWCFLDSSPEEGEESWLVIVGWSLAFEELVDVAGSAAHEEELGEAVEIE